MRDALGEKIFFTFLMEENSFALIYIVSLIAKVLKR